MKPEYEIEPDRKLAVWFSAEQWGSPWGMFCWATLPYVNKRVRSIHAKKAWRMRKIRNAVLRGGVLPSGPRR